MHHALLTPEILSNILEFVNLQLPWTDPFHGYSQLYDHNATLAALAVTCNTFLEPSLNVLWRAQLNLGPLLRTLPEGVWEEDEIGHHSHRPAYRIGLTRLPLGSEWSRFDFYARRVRELGHWRFEFSDRHTNNHSTVANRLLRREVTFGAVAILSLSRKKPWILPNLAKLRWNAQDSPNNDLLPFLLGPKLTRLAIGFHGSDEERSGFRVSTLVSPLASLVDICPTLTQLELYPPHSAPVVEAAVQFACRCPRLEGFIVTNPEPWSRSFLQHLARQPFLREVAIRMDDEIASDLDFLSSEPFRYPFPSLQVLSLHTTSLASCVTLIQIMPACRLQIVYLHLIDRVYPADLADLFTAFRDHCSRSTLQVLEIYRDESYDWTLTGEDAFHLDHMESLLSFPNIRIFVLAMPLVMEFGNEALRKIADAWPLLVSLGLEEGWGFNTPAEITWSGVAYLAHKCQQLINLTVSLDTRVDDVALILSLPKFRPNTSLRYLSVQDGLLGDADLFAQSLFAFAPLVVGIDGWGFENEELEITLPLEASAFFDQVEVLMWELRRTRMRDKFAFLDDYVTNEAEEMNPWASGTSKPARSFPYTKNGRRALLLPD